MDDNKAIYTPRDIAEKIGVAPNMVYLYSKEFSEYLEEFTVFTKEVNGHRRYSEGGLAVFYEIRRLMELPAYTYQRVHEEFRRRKEFNLGGPANVIQYQQLKKLEDLYGSDGEIVKQIYALVNAFGELVGKNTDLSRQNEVLLERLNQQGQEFNNINSEMLQKTNVLIDSFGDLAKSNEKLEEQSVEISEMVKKQGDTIISMEQNLGNITEDLRRKLRVDMAIEELEALEANKDEGFFSRLFGKRKKEIELRKARCRSIIESDRVAAENEKKTT